MSLLQLNATSTARLLKLGGTAFRGVQVLFVSYLLASMFSSSVVMFLMDQVSTNVAPASVARNDSESFLPVINYRDLQAAIRERNIFNSEGTFPDELDPAQLRAQQALVFDESAACVKTTLNIELLGTIFLGNPKSSIATIQEKGFSQADIYRAGDPILGVDNAKIHEVTQKRVVINNNGKKECLELEPDQELAAGGFGAGAGAFPVGGEGVGGGSEVAGGCTSASLDAQYIKAEFGTGFDLAFAKGRLVPHNANGQLVGFKIIGVDKGGVFGRACLQEGDVITQVNETSLQQPDQGFAFYQAFQEEQRVRLNVLRNGTIPMTINIDIK